MNIKRIFNSDLHNIHHAAFWLACFSILSAVLGMIRDRLLAGTYGATRDLDIYYAAFRVPDFLYTLMLLLTASTAFIPIFLKNFEEDESRARELFGSLVLFFLAVIVMFGILAYIFMPFFINLFLPGFGERGLGLATTLSRIMLLSPLFLGLSNIFSGITQSFRRFFVYGLSPVFYNLGIIFGILVFEKFWGLPGLAAGVSLGAFLHMAIQLPSILNSGVLPKIRKIWSADVRRVIFLSLPRTLGLEVTQISWTFFTAVASTLSPGSIAVFNLASNLEYIPITVIGLSYSVAAFPSLAIYSLKNARDRFEAHFSAAFRHILFWALPTSILLLVLRAQIVRVILGSGVFSWADTRLTAAALFLFSLAVVFQSMMLLLVRALYAEGESWRPVVINIISSVLSIGAVFWFAGLLAPEGNIHNFFAAALRISDIADIRVIAIPLGILVGSAINFLFLYFAFRVVFGWFPHKTSQKSIAEIFAGSLIGGASAYFGLKIFSAIFDLHAFSGVFLQGALSGILGLMAFAAALWIVENRELKEVFESVKSIFYEPALQKEKERVAAPEPEKLP